MMKRFSDVPMGFERDEIVRAMKFASKNGTGTYPTECVLDPFLDPICSVLKYAKIKKFDQENG